MNEISDLGKNLTKFRTNKNLSINKLKELAGVGYATIYDVEHGKKQNLSVSTLEKLATILEVSINDLLGIEELEFTVMDIEKTLEVILESDELELDNELLRIIEKEELSYLFKFAIETIRRKREQNK